VEENIDFILPITTRELRPLSEVKDQYAQNGIKVLISSTQSLMMANDKGELYRQLQNHGIRVPEFETAGHIEDALRLLDEFATRKNAFIFKPCVSNGSRGYRQVNKSLLDMNALLSNKPDNTIISLEEANRIFSSATEIPEFLFSEYLPGPEYSVDCLVSKKDRLIIPRLRAKINNGISVQGSIEQNEKIIKYCENILDIIPLVGPIGIQVKLNDHFEPCILEINPRLQGTSVALRGAGINLPALAVKLACSHEIDLDALMDEVRWGSRFIRYYDEKFFYG
jgi:carbamoyl-phosphate synthase large subunit